MTAHPFTKNYLGVKKYVSSDKPMVEIEELSEDACDKARVPTLPTLCLNMIVRQESQIIERCLTALVGVAREYAILDTGSTDDTVAKIKAFGAMTGVTGTEPFINFEQARNAALRFNFCHRVVG